MADKEGERPGQLTRLPQPDGQLGGNNREGQAGNPLIPMMEQEVSEKLKLTPKGEDPAFWPIRMFNELEYYISIKDEPTVSPAARAIGQKYASYEESIRKVKTAYAILAHPHCQESVRWGYRNEIEAELERDRQTYGRDRVELTDPEFQILNQITTARKIPLDPKKRVYSYSEVPLSPRIDPYGRRHLTTEEIRKKLSQNENGKNR